MLDKQIRSKLEQKMKDLIAGHVTPSEASYFANDLFHEGSNRRIIEASPSLFSLFDSIHMSNLPLNANGDLMYNIESYKKWYMEYEEEYAEEVKKG